MPTDHSPDRSEQTFVALLSLPICASVVMTAKELVCSQEVVQQEASEPMQVFAAAR